MNPTPKILQNLAYGLMFMILLSSTGSTISRPCNWNQYQGNEAHTAYADSDIGPPIHLIWKRTLERGGISGSPVANGNQLVILSPLGTVMHDYALLCSEIREDGLQLIWQRSLSVVEPGTTPAIAGNTVVCPSDQMLFCFDLETGHTIWESEFYSSPLTPVFIQESNTLVVTTKSGGLSLVNASTGDIVWTQKSLKDVPCYFFGIVTAGDSKLFVCYATSDEEGIAAFDLQGTFLWKKTGELLHKYVDDNAYITLYTGGTLFVVGNPTTLFALNGDTGDTLWAYKGKTLLDALSADGKNIYVYSKTDEGVLCLDIDTGKEIWKSPPLFPGDRESQIIIDKSLVSTQNYVFICRHNIFFEENSQIFALDSHNGAVIWESEELKNLRGPLMLCKDAILAIAMDGDIIAFASDPELFIKQGDLFLSDGYTDKAINSYKKAAEIYEQKGNVSQYEEIQEKIEELESPVESSPSETTPPKTTPPQPSIPISFFVLIITGILIGIFIVYLLIKRKE